MKRQVRHRGFMRAGRECHHLLFDVDPDHHRLELKCSCGGIVEFSPGDLRALAELIAGEAKANSAWELAPGGATAAA